MVRFYSNYSNYSDYSDYSGYSIYRLKLFDDGSDDEPEVLGDGWQGAVVATHQAEALDERGTVVAGGHALLQIVGYGEGKMHEVVCLLHDADAPVEVGRETECGVVLGAEVAPGIEGLVADEHSLLETFPGQPFGRGETARTQV